MAQEELTPELCWRRDRTTPPEACSAVRACVKNGDAPTARCQGCPIGDRAYCPDLDQLSRSVLTFSATYDHPAHRGYRDTLLPHIFPRLGPASLRAWLRRREKAWEVYNALAEEEAERKRPKTGVTDGDYADGDA